MKVDMNQSRRNLLKLGGVALAMIPVVALAAKNDAMRTAMKYKDSPDGEKQCATCLQFVPGKTANDKGGCKLFPGDTEVSPKGSCVAWAKKA
ncbi:MAG: high-potential iron-sulfur protein [Rhodocyclaceae bacterium]|nr:high-potential iron-sulfur protein [Rhodocyclaceae bacterium]